MQKVTLICDVCGTDKAVRSFRINLGCEMDASGNGYNTNWDYKEYCPSCLNMVKSSDLKLKIQPYTGHGY